MTYSEYLKQYNRLIKRFLALGVKYIRKVFWQLQKNQIKQYAKIQLKSMRAALRNLAD